MFTFTLTADNERGTVMFQGDIDIDASETIEEQILPALAAYTSILIDFTEVQFVDSTGIGLLIRLAQSLQEEGRAIRFQNIQPEVREVFELLQLEDILGVEVFAST